MISRKQAEIILDSLADSERREGKDSNAKKLNFICGYILIESCSLPRRKRRET